MPQDNQGEDHVYGNSREKHIVFLLTQYYRVLQRNKSEAPYI